MWLLAQLQIADTFEVTFRHCFIEAEESEVVLMLAILLGVVAGLAVTNIGEWFIHKYVLHVLGRKKSSFWAFHWHQHHRSVRRMKMVDPLYVMEATGEHTFSREIKSLLAVAVIGGAALLLFVPSFVVTVWYRMYRYYVVHRRSHLDTEWAKTNLPWHYDHHLGKSQNANWCVTHPWFDYVMGTRVKYRYEGGVTVPVPLTGKGLVGRLLEGFKESWATRRPKLPEGPPKPKNQVA